MFLGVILMRVEFSLSRRSQMDSNTKKRENHNEKIRPHYLNAIHSSPDKFSSFLLENKLQSKFVVGFGRQDIFDKGTGFFFPLLNYPSNASNISIKSTPTRDKWFKVDFK